ncbi:MAG TPA: hypothetical protein VM694_33570, partial [Polyangium sp.]|nr:hypothetical protein [Polyangium sp.]
MKRAPFWFFALVAACGGAPASPSASPAGAASPSTHAKHGDLPAPSLLPRPTFDLPPVAGPSASLANVLRASHSIVVGTISDIHAFTRPCAVDLVLGVRPEMRLLGDRFQGNEQRPLLVSFPRAADEK